MADTLNNARGARRRPAVSGLVVNTTSVSGELDSEKSSLDRKFLSFIRSLNDRNYSFYPLDERIPSFDRGRIYLRYDLLPEAADFRTAMKLGALHERVKIPGSFHIPWDLIEDNAPLKAAAVSLRQFDPNWVTLGIQCDPVSGWLARTRFGGNERRLLEFARSPALTEFLKDMLATWRREGNDGPALRTIRDGAWNRLMGLLQSARDALGDCKSISGRGSPLSNAFGKAMQDMPVLSTIAGCVSSIDFLVSVQGELQKLGYGCEATRFPSDNRPGASVFFCGDEKSRLRKALRIRVGGGDGFMAIFPIKCWETDQCANLVVDSDAPRFSGTEHQELRISGTDTSGRRSIDTFVTSIAHATTRIDLPKGAGEHRADGITEVRDISSPATHHLIQNIPETPVLTNPADLTPLGPRCEWLNTKELCAAARQKLGSGIDVSFPRFVEWLRSANYSFGGFETGPPRFDERWAYLRYDVHGQDLLATYVLAQLHERLGIIGSFQINWRHTRAEEAIEPYFLKLMEFDRRYVQFGLHAAPTATWYLQEKLDGNLSRQRDAVFTEGFVTWLLDLLAAYNRDGEGAAGLREIREGTDDTLGSIVGSFRQAFGIWKSISGHGNYLTAGFVRARQMHPELKPLEPYFMPVEYMRKFGVKRFGFDFEVTAFGSDRSRFPRLMTEGVSEEVRRLLYRGRVGEGLGFVALLHPATWTCRHNASFFKPGPTSDAAR